MWFQCLRFIQIKYNDYIRIPAGGSPVFEEDDWILLLFAHALTISCLLLLNFAENTVKLLTVKK